MIVKLLEDSVGTPLRAPGFPARLDPTRREIEFRHGRIQNEHKGDAKPQQNKTFALRRRCYSAN